MSLYLTLFWKEGEGERGIGKKERDREREGSYQNHLLKLSLFLDKKNGLRKEKKVNFLETFYDIQSKACEYKCTHLLAQECSLLP
jgi:hypothetical protein